jgi:hypothetical protein
MFSAFFKGLKAQPRWVRMALVFTTSFAFGSCVQWFAIRTRLYDTLVHNKQVRRHELDEYVVELQGNIRKWQEEDRRRLEDN